MKWVKKYKVGDTILIVDGPTRFLGNIEKILKITEHGIHTDLDTENPWTFPGNIILVCHECLQANCLLLREI